MADSKETPDNLKYTKEHEWLRSTGETLEIGITAFAADQLGDVVFVELPEAGSTIVAGEPFGVVESVKSVSDLFAPVTGTVTEINETLLDAPELVNESSYGEGWMIRVKPDNAQEIEGLLSAADYKKGLE
jgi:glycine cleavage system H protein